MPTTENEGFTVSDLEILRFETEERIKQLESELTGPLENMIILRRLLESQRNSLAKVNYEIEKKRLG